MGVLNAGKLDRLVRLYHPTFSANTANGEKVPSFGTAYATVWAMRQDLSGMKRIAAQQKIGEAQVEWTIRYRADLSVHDQLLEAETGLKYEILWPSQLGVREGLTLLCRVMPP